MAGHPSACAVSRPGGFDGLHERCHATPSQSGIFPSASAEQGVEKVSTWIAKPRRGKTSALCRSRASRRECYWVTRLSDQFMKQMSITAGISCSKCGLFLFPFIRQFQPIIFPTGASYFLERTRNGCLLIVYRNTRTRKEYIFFGLVIYYLISVVLGIVLSQYQYGGCSIGAP